MDVFITLIAFVGILAVLILVHEVGHFIAARLSKVKVEELGLGFPPRLLSYKKGETLYSLNLIPLGGFCRMAGEEDPSVPGSLAAKSVKARLFVLGAGPLMNALLPILLFAIAFMIPTSVIVGDVVVNEVAPGSPADSAGIMPGDIIREVDGHEVENIGDYSYYTHLNLGADVSVLFERDGAEMATSLKPRWDPPEGEGATGVTLPLPENMPNATTVSEWSPPWRAVPKAGIQIWETMVLFKNEVERLIITKDTPDVAGPVGIAQLTGDVAEGGFGLLLQFAAFLSINLAIVNLLPIPALDGGRIVFVALEGIRRGKKISPKREQMIHLIGFAIIISIMLAVAYQDIVRIIRGESLIP